MTTVARKQRRRWTPDDLARLDRLIAQATPTRVIALKLGRTPQAIYNKACELGVSVKATKRSPYACRKLRR